MATEKKELKRPTNLYFPNKESKLEFIPSGSVLLDCVLGGGWPIGRVVNVVGDKSSGKTLLAIEVAANFSIHYPNGAVFYNEVESSFDENYARALGLPTASVKFVEECFTVEDFYEHLTKVLDELEDNQPCLYILDSLDALSDRAEASRAIDDATYGANKAKVMSQIFRKIVQKMATKKVLLFIISQVRDNIGVFIGEKYKRSGGKALDFYASQALWLAQIGKLTKTVNSVKKVVGVNIKAECKKNKISVPYRSCELPIIFGYGIDDYAACIGWLKKVGHLDKVGIDEKELHKLARQRLYENSTDEKIVEKVLHITKQIWYKVEEDFWPTVLKYNS